MQSLDPALSALRLHCPKVRTGVFDVTRFTSERCVRTAHQAHSPGRSTRPAGRVELLRTAWRTVGEVISQLLREMKERRRLCIHVDASHQSLVEELETALVKEREARDRDADQARAKHSRIIADYEAELAELKERLRQRDQTISHLDRVVLALRTYVARARRRLIDNEVDVPEEVEGMND